MAKYEEILISDYDKLFAQKKELLIKLDSASLNLFKIKMIENQIYKDYNLISRIFLWKKIGQLIRIEQKAKTRFNKLSNKYWPIDKKINDIKNTLFKYYDDQIEESILELGIENITSLQDLLNLRDERTFEQFEEDTELE